MEIKFLELPSGAKPVNEFLQTLKSKAPKAVIHIYGKLRQFRENPEVYMRDPKLFKRVRGYEKYKLAEFRFTHNKTQYRILVTTQNGECHLIHGLVKKRDKIPKSDLDTAVGRIKQTIFYNSKI